MEGGLMTKRQLVWCTQCNVLTLFSPLDRTPEYRNQKGEWEIEERDDQATFMETHRRHHLEELHVVANSFISRQNHAEPVKTSYFEVTNGRQRFVVKKSRKSVLDPQRYEIIPGKLHLTLRKPSIDGLAIQRELERVFSPHQISSRKIHGFVQGFADAVAHLDPKKLKQAPFESRNPSKRYFVLDERLLPKVLKSSSTSLTKKEAKLLDEFFQKNLEEPFLMPVAVVEFEIQKRGKNGEAEIKAA